MGPSIKMFKDNIQFSVSMSLETHDTDYKNRLIQSIYTKIVVCIRYYNICKLYDKSVVCYKHPTLPLLIEHQEKCKIRGCHNDDYKDLRLSCWWLKI